MKKELANRLSSMTPEEIRSLLKRNPKKSLDKVKEKLKMKRNEKEEYPLSSTEERTWFLCQLNLESPINNNAFAIKIKSKNRVKPEIFEQALKLLADRHEILRTSFHSRKGRPFQKIHKSVDFKVEYLDLQHLSKRNREDKIIGEAVKEAHKIFDLSKCPLLNFKILHIEKNEYVYLITPHHIISDGWSNAIFSREFIQIYTSLVNNTSLNLPELNYQYVDYVNWEKHWLQSDKYKEYLNYWKKQLENIEDLEFPKDFQRPNIMSTDGAMESIVLDDNLAKELKDFSQQRAVNLFSTLLSIFNILLYKYTGQNNITIGTPMANHNKNEFQNVMGMFLNTLPIPTVINENNTFVEYINQTSKISQGAFIHQELPFDKLIEELKPPRDMSKHPLFQIMFVFQNIPSLYKTNGIDMIPLKIDYHLSKFDIDLWVEEADNKMIISLKYFTDLFKKSTIRRFLKHYQILMNDAVSNPNKMIVDLNYIPNDEKIFLLSNASKQKFKNSDKTFIDYFEKQANSHKENLAVQYLEKTVSYQELNALANSLAHYLRKKGIKKGDIVGLMTKRSEKSIIALIGIMKSGASYLPIDSSTPAERLKYIIDNSKIKTILTEKIFSKKLRDYEIEQVLIDENWQKIINEDKNNLDIDINLSDLAYIIYTSGTTGMPKGVCIEHRQLLNYTLSIWSKMKLPGINRFATVSSLSADLGNTMIFPALSNGASVNIIDDDYLTNLELFSSYIAGNKIDCIKLTPSHLNSLLTSENKSVLPEKLLVLGGETLSWQLIDRIRKLKPELRIINHYGPTETTTGVLTYEIPLSNYKKKEQFSVPIGFPLDNSQTYILDKYLKVVPIGVKGEIYIGGENLANGYMNNSELTQKYFIQNPFNINERLYKTGDFAKYLDDNTILFLGRKDKQVKIRGYRVELEGIEQIISNHQDIMQVVLLKKSKTEQLIAYIKFKENTIITEESLRNYLKPKLPTYMIPDIFIFVDEIPITKNGKINFDKLIAIGESKSVDEPSSQAPRDNLELEITNVWKKILSINKIGINDNFFEIGGQSLIAVELFSELHKKFDIDLPLSVLFENGTIKDLAEIIRSKNKYSNNSPLVTIQEGDNKSPIFLVHPAGGNVLSYYDFSQSMGKSYPVYGLQSTLELDWNSPDFSINKMARYYLDVILSSGFKPPFIFGGWSMGALVAYEMAIICQKENISMPLVIVIDQVAPENDKVKNYRQINELDRLTIFADKVGHLIKHKLDITREQLNNLTAKETANLFLNEFKKHNLVPADVQLEKFKDFLDIMIKHNEVTMDYNPEIYNGKVLIIKAEHSFEIDSSLKKASELFRPRAKDLGWQVYIKNNVNIILVPGDHISMMTKPNINILAEKLKHWIEDNNL